MGNGATLGNLTSGNPLVTGLLDARAAMRVIHALLYVNVGLPTPAKHGIINAVHQAKKETLVTPLDHVVAVSIVKQVVMFVVHLGNMATIVI